MEFGIIKQGNLFRLVHQPMECNKDNNYRHIINLNGGKIAIPPNSKNIISHGGFGTYFRPKKNEKTIKDLELIASILGCIPYNTDIYVPTINHGTSSISRRSQIKEDRFNRDITKWTLVQIFEDPEIFTFGNKTDLDNLEQTAEQLDAKYAVFIPSNPKMKPENLPAALTAHFYREK